VHEAQRSAVRHVSRPHPGRLQRPDGRRDVQGERPVGGQRAARDERHHGLLLHERRLAL
ncbi:MAG: hypothetical protein AVDCRST_MAG40-47, partial [uncultured Gemmatimonadaceae bacterium]